MLVRMIFISSAVGNRRKRSWRWWFMMCCHTSTLLHFLSLDWWARFLPDDFTPSEDSGFWWLESIRCEKWHLRVFFICIWNICIITLRIERILYSTLTLTNTIHSIRMRFHHENSTYDFCGKNTAYLLLALILALLWFDNNQVFPVDRNQQITTSCIGKLHFSNCIVHLLCRNFCNWKKQECGTCVDSTRVLFSKVSFFVPAWPACVEPRCNIIWIYQPCPIASSNSHMTL